MSTKKYDVIDPTTAALNPRIFTDEATYRDELKQIFGRAWLLIGHESLIPKPGDFFHTYMGEEPVILSRGRDGAVNALLNLCRHRGARLVRFDDGNCDTFTCAYHGWAYGLDGKLEFVPGEQEAYDGQLDREKLGLRRARVSIYAGLVFATWDEEAPSLEQYLGDARWYMDTTYNRYDAGTVAYGPHKWVQPVNWKTPVDNGTDWYHVPTTHVSASNALNRVLGTERLTHQWNWNADWRQVTVNGHQINVEFTDEAEPTEEAVRRLGEHRAKHIQMHNLNLFPNGCIGLRLALPRGPLKTEFWDFALVPADASEEVKRKMLAAHAHQNGVSGAFETDDIDNWRQMTDSGLSVVLEENGHTVNMGLGNEATDEAIPGAVSDRFVSENNQRLFYQRWQEFMNAESWADISLDPERAVYEGTTESAV